MTDPDARRVAVEVQAGDPITGRLTSPDGTVREFSGWLGLALELERALGGPVQPPSTTVRGDPSC